MKQAIYFFPAEIFNKLGYGDTTKGYIMRDKADIVIIGHSVIKHSSLKVPFSVSNEEIVQMKKEFDGIIVIAATL